MKKKKKKREAGFESGIFYAMQYLVIIRDEPLFAVELALQNGLTREWCLREQKLSGYENRRMNAFIKECL